MVIRDTYVQQVERRSEIHSVVLERQLDGLAHCFETRKVNHRIEVVLLKELLQLALIGHLRGSTKGWLYKDQKHGDNKMKESARLKKWMIHNTRH